MTQILGILNITKDSFSDGGKFIEPKAALAHAQLLVEDGADIIDVGAASSHPDAEDVSAADEIARLESVWEGLQKLNVPLSVDSFQPEVQRWAIKNGAQWLNDVSGFANPEIYDDIAKSDVRLIMMRALRGKFVENETTEISANFLEETLEFFAARLQNMRNAGIEAQRVVLDPGMGFFLSDKPDASLLMLRAAAFIRRQFGLQVLVGVSRKSFLQNIAGIKAEDAEVISFAAETYAISTGVDYIRTHSPRPLRQAMPFYKAMQFQPAAPTGQEEPAQEK